MQDVPIAVAIEGHALVKQWVRGGKNGTETERIVWKVISGCGLQVTWLSCDVGTVLNASQRRELIEKIRMYFLIILTL